MVLLVLLNRTRSGFCVGETDCGECNMNGWLVLRQTLVLRGKECELVRGECEVPVTYLPAGYVSPMARSSCTRPRLIYCKIVLRTAGVV